MNRSFQTIALAVFVGVLVATVGSTGAGVAKSSRYPSAQSRLSFHRYGNQNPRTTFVAGGSELPALGYEGASSQTSNPSTPVAGSAWYYFKTVLTNPQITVQYCQTGDAFGKALYEGIPGATSGVNAPCPFGFVPNSSNGFGAPAALALTDPDVVGSDSPPRQSDYNQFISNKGSTRGEPVVLPELAGSIAIMYNNPDTGASPINLTDAQICLIVNSQTLNWNQLGFNSRNATFVYRTDATGTTFSLSNHIAPVCSGAGFSVSDQFVQGQNTSPPYVTFSRTYYMGAFGNVSVIQTILSTPGAIGYVDSGAALPSLSPPKGINLAKLNGFDPIKNLPETVAKLNGVTSVVKDSVVVTNGGAVTTAAIKPAPTHAGCVLLVKPFAYANLSGGYPILSVSYHLYGYAGNGTNSANLRTLAQELSKSGIFYNNHIGTKNITTMDAATSIVGTGTTGYAAFGSSFQTPVKTASNACINT